MIKQVVGSQGAGAHPQNLPTLARSGAHVHIQVQNTDIGYTNTKTNTDTNCIRGLYWVQLLSIKYHHFMVTQFLNYLGTQGYMYPQVSNKFCIKPSMTDFFVASQQEAEG